MNSTWRVAGSSSVWFHSARTVAPSGGCEAPVSAASAMIGAMPALSGSAANRLSAVA